MIDTTNGFTLQREVDATPAELFRAWTDPDEVSAWLHPKGMRTPRASVSFDATVGGRYAFTMVSDADGAEYPTGGVYLEVVQDQKLVFTWGRPDHDVDDAPIVTVTFEPLGELTRMTFDLRGVDGMPGDNSFFDAWESTLDELVSWAS